MGSNVAGIYRQTLCSSDRVLFQTTSSFLQYKSENVELGKKRYMIIQFPLTTSQGKVQELFKTITCSTSYKFKTYIYSCHTKCGQKVPNFHFKINTYELVLLHALDITSEILQFLKLIKKLGKSNIVQPRPTVRPTKKYKMLIIIPNRRRGELL